MNKIFGGSIERIGSANLRDRTDSLPQSIVGKQ